MHRGHRVPGPLPRPQLGGQLGEPRGQHGAVLGGELPGDARLRQVPVGRRQRHRGLPRARQPVQGHDPRPRTLAPGQPAVQLGEQVFPAGQQRRWQGQPQRPGRARRSRGLLRQFGLDPGAQPLNQAHVVAELPGPHIPGDLIPERHDPRQLLGVCQVAEAGIRDAGAQQRDPRNAGLAGPPVFQMGDRQALRVALRRLEAIPMPNDQHVQVTRGHITQAAGLHRGTIRPVTVHRLMPGRNQPVHDGPAFPLQIGDRGGHINPGHHHSHPHTSDLTIAQRNLPHQPAEAGERAEACLLHSREPITLF